VRRVVERADGRARARRYGARALGESIRVARARDARERTRETIRTTKKTGVMVGGVWANVVRERAVGEGGETTRAREENDHHGRGRGARSSSMRHSVGANTAIEGVVNGREGGGGGGGGGKHHHGGGGGLGGGGRERYHHGGGRWTNGNGGRGARSGFERNGARGGGDGETTTSTRGAQGDLENLIARIEETDVSELENLLRESSFRPEAPAYTSLIKACGAKGQWQKALEAYRLMTPVHGAKPNTITCSALINSLGKSKQCAEAFAIFDEMTELNIPANIFTYSALLSACAKAKQFDRAMAVFEDLVENHPEIEIDRITYGAAISCCVQGRRADKAIELFNRMVDSGIKGNTITFNAVLNACEKCGDAVKAIETFERMRAENVPIDRSSFHSIISTLDQVRDLPKAMTYYKMMRDYGVSPDAATVSNMLLACANVKDALTAMRVYQEARNKYEIPCTPGMFNSLITALHRGKRYDMVYEQLYDSMTRSALSVSTYTHLMMACERFGNWQKSFELFREFKRHSPTSTEPFVWTRAFYACGRFDNDDPVWKNGTVPGYISPELQIARGVLQDLWAEYKFKTSPSRDPQVIQMGTIPAVNEPEVRVPERAAYQYDETQLLTVYRSAAAAAARCSDPDTVLDILCTCEQRYVPRDSIVYGAYVAALALNGDRSGADEKLREMYAFGFQPGVPVYAALARAAARAGDAMTALDLAEEVKHLVGNAVGDSAILDAVVAACEAGGSWTRGVNLFTIWAKHGVIGANEELSRAIAASTGNDPGPVQRGLYHRDWNAVIPPPNRTQKSLTAEVKPFVPRSKLETSQASESDEASADTSSEKVIDTQS